MISKRAGTRSSKDNVQSFIDMPRAQFFFSGLHSFWKPLEEYGVRGFNELISAYYARELKWSWDTINELCEKRNMVMMDSGAFTAFNKGQVIDVDDFIRWMKELEKECPKVRWKAGLDDLKEWQISIKNQEKTDAAGLKLFPTFHRFDPPHVHDWIIDRKYELYAFGGLVQDALTASDAIAAWLDGCYEKICDSEGRPTQQVHLFGVSNIELINRYPCYSSDSASALFTGSFGCIHIPTLDPFTHKPDFTKPMVRMSVSDESPNAAKANQHFDTLKKDQREIVRAFVETVPGFTIEKLKERHEARKVFCVIMQRRQAEEGFPEDARFVKPMSESFF